MIYLEGDALEREGQRPAHPLHESVAGGSQDHGYTARMSAEPSVQGTGGIAPQRLTRRVVAAITCSKSASSGELASANTGITRPPTNETER